MDSRTYIHMLKSVAESTAMPQAFFDNPNRSFDPIPNEDPELEPTPRDPSNTTIAEALEAHGPTRGATATYTREDGQVFIMCGVPNMIWEEILAVRDMSKEYADAVHAGDMSFKTLLSVMEAREVRKTYPK